MQPETGQFTFSLFKRNVSRRRFPWKPLLIVFLVISLLGGSFFFYLYVEVKGRFSSRRWSVPSRVFSAMVPLYPGQTLSMMQVKWLLEERRYQEAVREPLKPGEFKAGRGGLTVHFREFRFPGHGIASQRVQFEFQQNRIVRISNLKTELPFVELEPLEIARLFGPTRESRLIIGLHQVPKVLIDGVLAVEDHRFYEHKGIDWWGILRAVWTDVRARRVVQGGSTITQQLVKNYFLDPDRNFKRKVLEASMAIVIEAMYGKDEILEMYLNEIYLGQRSSVAIHGVGEAARYFFGRNVEDLTLADSATLAGMIRAPNALSPLLHPDAALERRNLVLKRMLGLGKISADEYNRAVTEPLVTPHMHLPVNVAPYFVDYVRRQLTDLYSAEMLESEGLTIYTSLQPELSLAATEAVREGLKELEGLAADEGTEGREGKLQAVLIVVQPRTGAVLALCGGGDEDETDLGRAQNAVRQAGTIVMPFVYLGALDTFAPVSVVSDDRASYPLGGGEWVPPGGDEGYRGPVSFRTALQDALNAATVRVAATVGFEKVASTFGAFGIRIPAIAPSISLGEFGATPMEMAGAYAALSNDGQRPYLLSLREVVTEDERLLERRNVEFVSVTTPAKAYIVTDLLRGSIERGASRIVKYLGIDFPCAGQVGTTVQAADSWFAGYTPDMLALVWVGYDDHSAMSFQGAEGAARIWSRFMNAARPWINPQPFRIPPGIVQRIICTDSGQIATSYCRNRALEVFLAEQVPKEDCTLHIRE